MGRGAYKRRVQLKVRLALEPKRALTDEERTPSLSRGSTRQWGKAATLRRVEWVQNFVHTQPEARIDAWRVGLPSADLP